MEFLAKFIEWAVSLAGKITLFEGETEAAGILSLIAKAFESIDLGTIFSNLAAIFG